MKKMVCVVGNGVAALVSAKKQLELGNNVVMIAKNTRFGGIFSGLTVLGKHYDYGMLLLEYGTLSSHHKTDLSEYSIDKIHETAHYAPLIKRFLNNLDFNNNKVRSPEAMIVVARAADKRYFDEYQCYRQQKGKTKQDSFDKKSWNWVDIELIKKLLSQHPLQLIEIRQNAQELPLKAFFDIVIRRSN
jgi:monoamine oxidase